MTIPDNGWNEKFAPLLGTMPDAEVAKLAGSSPQYIHKLRRNRNIAAFGKGGRSLREWTKSEQSLLGKNTDKKIAAQLGISEQTVSQERQRLGIEGFKRRPLLKITPEQTELLGKSPDITLAKLWGHKTGQVTRLRKSLGIPRFQNKKGKKGRDLTGMILSNKSIVLHPGEKEDQWVCKCVCGNEYKADRRNLLDGRVKSCGCLSKKYREFMKAMGKLWMESQN